MLPSFFKKQKLLWTDPTCLQLQHLSFLKFIFSLLPALNCIRDTPSGNHLSINWFQSLGTPTWDQTEAWTPNKQTKLIVSLCAATKLMTVITQLVQTTLTRLMS
jgi:hypothetical protein